MSAVFGDTYYFLGLLNRSDGAHQKCINFARSYTGLILTTEYVLVELLDGLSATSDRRATARFIRSLGTDSGIEIIPASPALFERALTLYEQRLDALTADHDFEQAGFKALLK